MVRNYVVIEDARDRILDATDRLLARYGYKKMTVEDLAAEVGIGKGSIYLHFSSKEDVVLSQIDRLIERLKERLEEIGRSPASAPDRLREMLITRVMYRFDQVSHYGQSLNDLLAAIRPQLLARRRRYFEEEAAILATVVEEGVQQSLFEVADAMNTARLLLVATNSLLPYSLSTAELGRRSEILVQITGLADLLVVGVLKHDS
jgi:AcrR family transcriptional regulator